jgi:6-phosphogluconolactonase
MFGYIGTLTQSRGDEGIHVVRVDPATGAMKRIQHVRVPNPSYLAISASRRVLYAASRRSTPDQPEDAIISYAIDTGSGYLTPIGQTQVPSQPAYVSLDRTERFAFFACTFGGAVGVVPILDGGRVDTAKLVLHEGASLDKQGFTIWPGGTAGGLPSGSPFPHSIRVAPDNRFVLVPDVGLNRVAVYRFDADRGLLVPNAPAWAEGSPFAGPVLRGNLGHWESPRGAGPRHLEFHPNGRWVYVVNELGSLVTVFAYDAEQGRLSSVQAITTLPENYGKYSITADIHVHPNGRFLYASNRGHDSIVIYAIHQTNGTLSPIGFESTGGEHPRNFVFSPDAKLLFVGNLTSNTIKVFEIDESTGRLKPNGTSNEVPSPSCTVFFRP